MTIDKRLELRKFDIILIREPAKISGLTQIIQQAKFTYKALENEFKKKSKKKIKKHVDKQIEKNENETKAIESQI